MEGDWEQPGSVCVLLRQEEDESSVPHPLEVGTEGIVCLKCSGQSKAGLGSKVGGGNPELRDTNLC